MTSKVILIAGAGGVLGVALSKEFSGVGHVVKGLRSNSSDAPLDPTQEVAKVVAELGEIEVLIYNAAQLVVAPFMDLTLRDFEDSWRACVGGAVEYVQAVLPGMLSRGGGTVIFSGATASLRGASNFAAFASAKYALRGLAQSLAREHQAHGIHVVHVVLDGLLRGSASAARFGGGDMQTIDPVEVAKIYRWLADQHASAWTHEIDLRPNCEKF